jgi:hypothetical protein
MRSEMRKARAAVHPARASSPSESLGLLDDGTLSDWALCDGAFSDGPVSLDVRLIVRPLGNGALGYWTLGDWTFSHWPVTLDLGVRGAGLLVRHLLLLLVRRAQCAVLINKTAREPEIFPPTLRFRKRR